MYALERVYSLVNLYPALPPANQNGPRGSFRAQVQKKINGAHSRMMSIITGKTPREETTRGTQTMDLLMRIRARRLQWLGQILRMQDDRMIKNVVMQV